MDEKGKTALITGASSGIGYEIARVFAQNGHNVVLVARSETELQRIAGELADQYRVKAQVFAKDLFHPDAARELYNEVTVSGTRVDYLVNDAGQGVWGKFSDTDLARELGIIQLNVVSLVVLTKLFLKDMLLRDEGRILQLASIVSKAPAPWSAVYSATKAFILNFSEAVSEELIGTNVTMTALRPGATDTDFFRKAGAEDSRVVQDMTLASAARVAQDGYEAMMRGDTVFVSGLQNRVQDTIGRVMPDKLVAKAMGKLHEPKQGDRGRTQPSH